MIRNSLMILILLTLLSCHNNPPAPKVAAQDSSMIRAAALRTHLKKLNFDYKKDPTCGMPLTAGLEDTLHYKGKLYGFCSKECKEAFLQNPDSSLAQIK